MGRRFRNKFIIILIMLIGFFVGMIMWLGNRFLGINWGSLFNK